jgi:hypothetical protein
MFIHLTSALAGMVSFTPWLHQPREKQPSRLKHRAESLVGPQSRSLRFWSRDISLARVRNRTTIPPSSPATEVTVFPELYGSFTSTAPFLVLTNEIIRRGVPSNAMRIMLSENAHLDMGIPDRLTADCSRISSSL